MSSDADANVWHTKPAQISYSPGLDPYWRQCFCANSKKILENEWITFSVGFVWWFSACQERKPNKKIWDEWKSPSDFFLGKAWQLLFTDSTNPKYQLNTHFPCIYFLLQWALLVASISFYREKLWLSTWKYPSVQ